MPYTLKAVCAYLDATPAALRKWEARYRGLVRPARARNGYRVYSEEDLRRLRSFLRHRAAGLPGEEASRLAAAEGSSAPSPGAGKVAAALRALERFDRPSVHDAFDESVRRHGLLEAFAGLWLPVLEELGRRSHAGRPLWVAVEHFASAFLREKILERLAKGSPAGRPALAVCAPEGDRHELGMLLACCALEQRGIRCVYLGPDLPLPAIRAALDHLAPGGLSLTLSAARNRRDLRPLLAALRRPGLELFVCGRESLRHANLIRESGARFIGTDLERGADLIARTLSGEAR